jgi:1-acyl-sn-glycerol-3-phosphate acyltransferase
MWRIILRVVYFPYKWLVFFPVLAINTLIFGVIAVVISSLVNQRVGSYYGGVVWSRFNALITPMFVKVRGKKNIQKGVSYIVIPNHQSLYDIFLLYGWLGIDIKWIMKKELRKLPGVGFGSAKVGHIFIDRSNQRAALESLNEAKKKLKDGTSVVIFPEGTRSISGKIIPFKRGAFKLALDLNLPILPVTINGTRNIMPAKAITNILPGKVSMTIHEPIDISEYDDNNVKELMGNVKAIIESALN